MFRMFFVFFWVYQAAMATGNIEIRHPTDDYRDYFGQIIQKAGMRLQEAAQKRPLKLKTMNNSIVLTAAAARGMASRQAQGDVWSLLERARKEYPQNSFAGLLQAVLRNAEGDIDAANGLFKEFLLQSTKFTDFEGVFLDWGEFHRLRRIVYELLVARGVSLKEVAGQIQRQPALKEALAYLLNPGARDRFLMIFLLAGILGGIFLMVGCGLMGMDFSGRVGTALLIFYISIWISYGIWIVDIAFTLPLGLSRFHLIPLFLGGEVLALGGWLIAGHWKDRSRPLEVGYRRCPHCQAIILTLSVVCDRCKRPV